MPRRCFIPDKVPGRKEAGGGRREADGGRERQTEADESSKRQMEAARGRTQARGFSEDAGVLTRDFVQELRNKVRDDGGGSRGGVKGGGGACGDSAVSCV